MLKPRDPAHGNGAVLFEVSNRGRKGMLDMYNRGGRFARSATSDDEFGDGFLLEHGYTLVWLGWQFDVPHSAGLMRLYAPVRWRRPSPGWCAPNSCSITRRPANRWPTAITLPIRR